MVFIICGQGEEGGWFVVSEAGGEVVIITVHLSPTSLEGGLVIWRAERLQNCVVGHHGCQLWLRPVLICLNYFLPQEGSLEGTGV